MGDPFSEALSKKWPVKRGEWKPTVTSLVVGGGPLVVNSPNNVISNCYFTTGPLPTNVTLASGGHTENHNRAHHKINDLEWQVKVLAAAVGINAVVSMVGLIFS